MDANLIYEKTPAGEEAVRQRTRLVQRNTRMILILVDGSSSVADLCTKTGNTQMVETALQDLERDGLIAPKLASDSVWEQGRKVAEEIRAAAISRLTKEERISVAEAPLSISSALTAPSLEPFSMAPHSIFAPDPSGGAPKPNLVGAPKSVPQAPVRQPEGKPLMERLLALIPSRSKPDDEGIAPIQRGSRGSYISWPLRVAMGVMALLVISAGAFLFYPYSSHRAAIEAAMSRHLGQPVTVGDVTARLSPSPAIVVERVATRSGDMQVASIRLVPELFSLLGARPSFSTVRFEGARLADRALSTLPSALAAAAGDAAFGMQRVQFARLELSALGLSLGDLQGESRLSANSPPASLELTNVDRSVRLVLKPQAGALLGEFEAFAWKPYAESPHQFDSVQGQLLWDGRALSVRSLDARIFDGSVRGALLFDSVATPTLAGDIAVKHMSVRRLASALGFGTQYEGELASEVRFSGSNARWADVPSGVSAEGSFTISRGVLGGFDLAEAVRRAGRAPLRGGATRYDQATGRLLIAPGSTRLVELSIGTGVLKSTGEMEIARDGKLGGRLDVEMRGSASVVRMPVTLSGSLKDPVLQGGR